MSPVQLCELICGAPVPLTRKIEWMKLLAEREKQCGGITAYPVGDKGFSECKKDMETARDALN